MTHSPILSATPLGQLRIAKALLLRRSDYPVAVGCATHMDLVANYIAEAADENQAWRVARNGCSTARYVLLTIDLGDWQRSTP